MSYNLCELIAPIAPLVAAYGQMPDSPVRKAVGLAIIRALDNALSQVTAQVSDESRDLLNCVSNPNASAGKRS